MFSLRGVTQDGDPPTMLQTRAKQPTTTTKKMQATIILR